MPIYEYECCACQYRFERKQGFHEEPVAVCPRCEGAVRRLLHSVPIIFKGSGFYVTDHRGNNSASDSAKAEPSGTAKAEAPKTVLPGPHKTAEDRK